MYVFWGAFSDRTIIGSLQGQGQHADPRSLSKIAEILRMDYLHMKSAYLGRNTG